jgi:hypothetical protein
VTIRAKLYVAIALTVLGPIATTGVALYGMAQMGDRFDDARTRAEKQALALELKFGVADVNGWQTAYGYDGGESRPQFERAAAAFQADLRRARRELTDDRERELLETLTRDFGGFMGLDVVAYRELQAGREERTREIFLGPSIERFEAMAATADDLARYEARQVAVADDRFDDARDDARRGLIAVGLGAGFVIVLLLVTANDIARMALEGERTVRGRSGDSGS